MNFKHDVLKQHELDGEFKFVNGEFIGVCAKCKQPIVQNRYGAWVSALKSERLNATQIVFDGIKFVTVVLVGLAVAVSILYKAIKWLDGAKK